jgi:hypothetical protein
MLTKIVEHLKTGPITNVIPYGSLPLPEPPYIVVKPERDTLGRGRAFRIVVHMLPGQQIFLEDFVRETLYTLLSEFTSASRHGNINQLDFGDEWSDIIIGNDDSTISMERVFLMPSLIF